MFFYFFIVLREKKLQNKRWSPFYVSYCNCLKYPDIARLIYIFLQLHYPFYCLAYTEPYIYQTHHIVILSYWLSDGMIDDKIYVYKNETRRDETTLQVSLLRSCRFFCTPGRKRIYIIWLMEQGMQLAQRYRKRLARHARSTYANAMNVSLSARFRAIPGRLAISSNGWW